MGPVNPSYTSGEDDVNAGDREARAAETTCIDDNQKELQQELLTSDVRNGFRHSSGKVTLLWSYDNTMMALTSQTSVS